MTLFEAVEAQDAGALEQLAAEVKDINAPFEGGRTALHEAAARGHLELVQVLLAAGADASVRDDDGETALLKAALNGQSAVVGILLPLAGDDERDLARCFMKQHGSTFD